MPNTAWKRRGRSMSDLQLQIKSLATQNGNPIPSLGLGTWKMQDGAAYQAVKSAIQVGYRHIDCAWIYGNQEDVGRAINESMKAGMVDRSELWVTSKLWNDRHQAPQVKLALKETLQQLQLDSLDLYLMHWPVAQKPGTAVPESADDFFSLKEVPLIETWQALEECVNDGLCREIGVSNFSIKKLKHLIDNSSTTPTVNQCESHPYLQQKPLINFCNEHQILFTAYSPLGSPDRPERLLKDNEPKLPEESVLLDLAEKHDASVQQVALAWAMQRGTLAIPKAVNPDHQRLNLLAASLTLEEPDLEAISELDRNYRFVDGTFWTKFGADYTLEELWDE